jgi:predicted ATPase
MKSRAFFGRRSELRALEARIAAGDRLITVAGVGGMGKTRLARELLARTEMATLFVDLGAVGTRAGLLDALALALQADAGRDADLAPQLEASLARRGDLLVVLDNFEQLIAAAGVLADLLAAAPRARFLVTSREILALSFETVLEVPPLDRGEELMLDRIQARRPGFAPTAKERAILARIATDLDGIPLALELAADRAALLGIDAVALGIARGAHLSAPAPRDALARHGTMQRALEGSWTALDPAEREALAACAVFRGGFAASDVPAVSSAGVAVLDPLQRLRSKSLVVVEHDRLRLLTVIRDFVRVQLSAVDVEVYSARHAAHFRATLEAPELRPDAISREWDNFDGALVHWLGVSPPTGTSIECACAMLLGIGETALRSGRLSVIAERCESLSAHGAHLGAAALAKISLLRSRIARRGGDLEGAERDLDRALKLAIASDDRALHAWILRQKSLRLARAGHLDEAIATFERARGVRDPEESGAGDAYDVLGLSSALRQSGDGERAQVLVEGYLKVASEPCDRALALFELTLAHFEQGHMDLGRRAAEEARELFQAMGWAAEEARAILFVALALQDVAVPPNARGVDAERHLRDAIACAAKAGGSSAAEYARGYLGLFALDRGDPVTAALELGSARPPDSGHRAFFAAYRAVARLQCGERKAAQAIAVDATRGTIPPALREAIALHAVHFELADAEAAAAAGQTARAAEAYGRATAALARDVDRRSADTQLALRIARRALERYRPPAVAVASETLLVHEGGEWFCLGDAPRTALTRQRNAGRALAFLAEERLARPGVGVPWQVLVERIWHGETMAESAAKNRLRVTLALLRKAGLRDLLLTSGSDYRLSEWVPVRIAPSRAGVGGEPRRPRASVAELRGRAGPSAD